MDTSTRTIYGVDFSGARDAGRKIWIAQGQVSGDGLIIRDCRPISEWLDCGRKRDACLDALYGFIAREKAVFGLDFPFGLPQKLMGEDGWEGFVRSFNERYRSPEDFKENCFRVADSRELKRKTDEKNNAPFSPYNLRLYKQTYYGINYVLRPLVDGGLASVLPMQDARPDRAWVLEVCPASTLRDWDIPSYKGPGAERRESRQRIVAKMSELGLIWEDNNLVDKVVNDREGDAIDSVIAAMATARVVSGTVVPKDGAYGLEGYIYV